MAADPIPFTVATFVAGFVLLFLIYYFTSPLYTEYGDGKSRLRYSLVNALYFSLAIALLFLALPAVSAAYGVVAGVAAGVAIVAAGTLVHVCTVTVMARRGLIKVRQKRRRR